jgi:hypothetical protein
MKAVLQHSVTGLYFQKRDQWTPDYLKAYDFKSSVTARNYCQSHGISNVQIVLKFDSARYDIVLPVIYPTPAEDPAGPSLGL